MYNVPVSSVQRCLRQTVTPSYGCWTTSFLRRPAVPSRWHANGAGTTWGSGRATLSLPVWRTGGSRPSCLATTTAVTARRAVGLRSVTSLTHRAGCRRGAPFLSSPVRPWPVSGGCQALAVPEARLVQTARPFTSSSAADSSPPPSWPDRAKVALRQMWAQYWGGTKQLWTDARVARELRRRAAGGTSALTRTETRFVRRVDHDLRALVPFAVVFMLPFSAYALPLIIKLFPGFLPSTYNPASFRINNMQERNRDRVEAAHKVRNALAQRLSRDDLGDSAKDRISLLEVVRRVEAGDTVTLKELQPFSSFFSIHFNLGNLEPPALSFSLYGLTVCPPELHALCQLYGLSTGPLPFYDLCVKQLRARTSHIYRDDKQLMREWEKLQNDLTEEELLEACAERGLSTAASLRREELVRQLAHWLEFSVSSPRLSKELVLFAPALTMPT